MKSTNQRLLSCAVLSIAAILLAGCGPIGPVQENIDPLVAEMATQPLVFDPVEATAVGYHQHTAAAAEGESGATTDLDTLLGDYSSSAIAAQVSFYNDINARLHSAEDMPPREKFNSERWINYAVVENRVARALYRLEKEQPFKHNPGFYVRVLGNGLFTPVVVEYAPEADRYADIIARLGQVPTLLEQAQANVTKSSELQIAAAKEGVDGLIALIQKGIPAKLPASLKGQYDGAAGPAVQALQGYNQFLSGLDSSADWRLGRTLYEERIKVYSRYEESLDSVLGGLQAEFDETYGQLIETARPIHRGIYGGQRAPNDFALMRDILDVVSDENRLSSGDGLVERIEQDVDEVKKFMKSEEVIVVPDVSLTIAKTPEFLSLTNPVDAFQAPPLLDPQEGAQYWITPIPADWSRAQTLSKLREYNNFKLKIVAIDGYARYAQAVLSAQLPDRNDRLLRNVDGNRGFTRGWNWYLIESSINLGFQSGGQQFKLNWLKYKLEFLASCILDIKLHAMDMPLEEARELLRRQVFMEAGAIESAVRKIQLTPTDTALSYIGSKQWQQVKEGYQEATTDFSLQSFHDKALTSGPMPPAELIYSTVNRHKD
ncbi:MAG: DUF885 family protein [Acidobacteria bacterium]|nr:DUF885 family protein [Acidobacteriota bacterium]